MRTAAAAALVVTSIGAALAKTSPGTVNFGSGQRQGAQRLQAWSPNEARGMREREASAA